MLGLGKEQPACGESADQVDHNGGSCGHGMGGQHQDQRGDQAGKYQRQHPQLGHMFAPNDKNHLAHQVIARRMGRIKDRHRT